MVGALVERLLNQQLTSNSPSTTKISWLGIVSGGPEREKARERESSLLPLLTSRERGSSTVPATVVRYQSVVDLRLPLRLRERASVVPFAAISARSFSVAFPAYGHE